MKIQIIPTGMIETNCVILSNAEGEALVIDPGADAPVLDRVLRESNLRVIGYPLTHGHYDHVCGLADMAALHPAACWMHPKDLAWAFTSVNQAPPWYLQPDPARLPTVTPAWELDGEFRIGGFSFQTLHLPGHSPGSVGFYFPAAGVLVGGDVLFKQSMGRTDLPGGNEAHLMNSLARLSQLPPETRVFPGHGPDTTIGEERATNPYLRMAMRGRASAKS